MQNSSRNPLLLINDKTVQTIGDPHLGRVYANGVPLHMRGSMEKKQRERFEELLDIRGVDYVVIMGDLLDDFIVDPTVVDYAADRILSAARSDPSKNIVLLRGNHDESKDLTRKSSYDNLVATLREAKLPNLHVVSNISILDGMAFVSWSARFSAKELAEQLDHTYDAVFGHWDVNLPTDANHYNAIPLAQLAGKTPVVITGHVHRPHKFDSDGIECVVTGSILPLAHGEEIDEDDLFYTLTRSAYDLDPSKYENKFVRFELQDGEELPEGNFLQVKAYTKPVKKIAETESEPDAVTFDLPQILRNYLVSNDIEEKFVETVVGRFNAKQNRD